jgi:energy-coupling factor transporter ATP-binding protein EcfA2
MATMYVDEIVLRDFRAIASSRVTFTHPRAAGAAQLDSPNLNLIVGMNGSGKSSVLKAIAAAMEQARGGVLPDSAARWPRIGGAGDALVQLRTTGSGGEATLEQLSLRLAPRTGAVGSPSSTYFSNIAGDAPSGLLAAYGSVRFASDEERVPEAENARRSHLLFDDVELVPPRAWLGDSPRRGESGDIFNALLPGDVRFLESPSAEGHLFAQRGIALPLAAMSDGVRSFIAWVADLLWRLDQEGNGRLAEVPGLVLVDEVDQRMHPGWQRSVLTRLASAFPALQFICTAHSPLLPSGLQRENLLLVEPDLDLAAEGATTVRRLESEEVYGRTADQVLESSYFGLTSTRSEPYWRALRETALEAQGGAGGREAALEFLRSLADPDRRRTSQ